MDVFYPIHKVGWTIYVSWFWRNVQRKKQENILPGSLTFNITPENRPGSKRKFVFQASFFSGELLNFGGVLQKDP